MKYELFISLFLSEDIFYLNKGTALFNLNELKEAIECYDKSIELNPNYSLAITNRNFALNKFYSVQ